MCVNTEAGWGWAGVWLRPGGSFHHVLMTQQICRVPQMEASKTSEISKFLLLIRFFKTSSKRQERVGEGGGREKPGEPQEIYKRY